MQITSKGQVTIPQEVRVGLGLLPHTEVNSRWSATMLVFARASAVAAWVQEERG